MDNMGMHTLAVLVTVLVKTVHVLDYKNCNDVNEVNKFETCSTLNFSHQALKDVNQIMSNIKILNVKNQVKVLDLSYNMLNNVTSEILSLFPNLTIVNLSHNNLSYLATDTFVNNNHLEVIIVSYNHIQILPSGLLGVNHELSKLKYLDASNNEIFEMGLDLFHEGLKSLAQVNMSRNNLTYFEPWPYRLYIHYRGIIKLYIHKPHIGIITPFFFDLTYNNISIFSNRMKHFLRLRYHIWVYLDFNNIRTIPLQSYQDFLGKRDLKSEDLILFNMFFFNNPWVCDCNIYPLIYLATKGQATMKYLSEDFIKCAEPYNLQNKTSRYLFNNRQVLVCDIDYNCPRGCLCERRPFEKHISVNCSGSVYFFLESPLQVPDVPFSWGLSLDLSHHAINNLSVSSYTRHITILNMAFNRLESIHPDFFLKARQLKLLDLRNNRLMYLPVTIKRIPFSAFIFQNNDFVCDCSFRWFNEWVRINSKNSTLTCKKDKKIQYIREVKYERNQCSQDIVLSASVTLAFISLLLSCAVVVCYKYRYQLKVVLFYIYPNTDKTCGTKEELDGYLYDVYISFDTENSERRRWIIATLLPKLNTFNISSYCPMLDSTFGESKLEVMAEKMLASRKILIVLDNSYLASGWCNEEFDFAHHTPIKANANEGKPLIILCDQDLNYENITQEPLNTYILQKRYIQIDSSLCWAKIKYELKA